MRSRLLNDHGGINVVKLFLFVAFAAIVLFGWVYVPAWLDYYTIRNSVRRGCNIAYSKREVEAVQAAILEGFKEAAIENEDIALDGSIIRRAMPYGTELFDVRLTETPPAVTVALSYEQRVVLPLLKKPRTIRFRMNHTEDLSSIKY